MGGSMLNEDLSGLRQKKNYQSSRNGQAPEMLKEHTHEQTTIGHYIRQERSQPIFFHFSPYCKASNFSNVEKNKTTTVS